MFVATKIFVNVKLAIFGTNSKPLLFVSLLSNISVSLIFALIRNFD